MGLDLFKVTMKDSWKGVLIYAGVLFLYGILIPLIYPEISSGFSDPMAEGEGVLLMETGKDREGFTTYNLSWEPRIGASLHVAMGAKDIVVYGVMKDYITENATSIMITDEQFEEAVKNRTGLAEFGINLLYIGSGDYIEFSRTDESAFFWVVFLKGEGNYTPVNISDPVSTSDLAITSAWDDYLEGNAMMEALIGTSMVDFSTLDGYIVIEFFSMWPLFFIIYIAIKSVGVVSKHVEDHSMDILLATGYSRERFLFEKYLTILLNMAAVVSGALIGLIAGVMLMGESLSMDGTLLTFGGSIPITLAFMGISVIISILVDEGSKAVGIVLGVVILQYIVQMVANLASWELVKYLTLFYYWDSAELMIDKALDPVNVIVPMVIAVLSVVLSFYLFRKKEIHA